MPGMPFNQMMLFPVTLTLRSTEEGPRMFAEPVREVANLHGRKQQWKNKTLKPDEKLLGSLGGQLAHIRADLKLAGAAETTLVIRGIPITYNVERKELSCQKSKAPLKAVDDQVRLEILVDRTSIEIFGNNGRMYMPVGVILVDNPTSFEISAKGGDAEIESLDVIQLRSAWR
jgi:sucrose-6-phosphate hydrolase SacC (GH32 family)